MIPLEDAQRLVLEACTPLAPVVLCRDDALGCVTAAPVMATEDVPSFANTAMDGYAVRAADTLGATEEAPARLAVVGSLAAGQESRTPVEPGQAVRIMTGAPMPPGADAVIMVELTRTDGSGVVLAGAEVPPGNHVRPAGDDLRAGQMVIPTGTELGPAHLGVLASIGMHEVTVHPPARVGVLSTGDELTDGTAPLRPGQIRDSNRPMLLALARRSGCVAVDLGQARDVEDELTEAIEGGLSTCDVILTSGGVSVGDFDYTKAVLDRLSGATMRWMQVAIRPAKPFAFGVVRGTPVFGLPGNPVSSMVSFECFARPALRAMMGHHRPGRPEITAVADEGLARQPDGKLHLIRVEAAPGPDGRYHVRSTGSQGSHQLLATARANALALVPDGKGVPPGGTVRTLLLSQ